MKTYNGVSWYVCRDERCCFFEDGSGMYLFEDVYDNNNVVGSTLKGGFEGERLQPEYHSYISPFRGSLLEKHVYRFTAGQRKRQ